MTLAIPIKSYLVVGSYPLNIRYSKDIDVICYRKDIEVEVGDDEYIVGFEYEGRRIECLLADKQESLQQLLYEYSVGSLTQLQICYILKAGHIHIAGRNQEVWQKHMMDLHFLRRLINPSAYVEKFVKLHKKSTNERIKQRSPRLKGVTKDAFFDDFVKKYIEHDSIHALVAHKEKPMYSYMQKDETVECHKDLWDKFDFEDQIACVAEECYVIAIERHILPTIMGEKVGLNDAKAFKWALYRVCTTLCSGWFRQFALDNYFTILNYFNKNRMNAAVEEIKKQLQQTCNK